MTERGKSRPSRVARARSADGDVGTGRGKGLLTPWEAAAAATAGVAVLLRVVFLFSLKETPFYLEHFSDSRLYMQLAAQIADGGIDSVFFMSPLYPYLVAAVAAVTGNPEFWVRILQALSGGATVWLVYRIGADVFGRAAGLGAAVLAAVYAPLIFYDGLLLTESLLTLLVTAHLYLLLRALRNGAAWEWGGAGLVLGLAVVTRATTVVFLPALVVVGLFTRGAHRPSPARLGLYAAAAMLALVPTALHNAGAGGVFMPVTSSFGFNLFAGNNASATGLYSMPQNIDLATDPNGHHWVEARTGKEMDAAEVSGYWRDRALAWMGAHPGDAASLLLRKLLLFFHPGGIDQLGLSMDFFTGQYGAVTGLPAAVFPLILLLAAGGMALALREQRGDWPLLLFFGVFVITTAVFFVSERLRLPVMPLMMLYATYGVVHVVTYLRSRGSHRSATVQTAPGAAPGDGAPFGGSAPFGGGALFGGVAVAAVVLLLQPDVRQGFELEYLKLGQSAFGRAQYQEAERWFRQSLDEQETVDGLVNLGNAVAAQQRPEEAAALYRRAIGRDSTHALAWFNFGNLRMQTGSPQYAYGYWKKAVEHDPRLAGARRNLGLLLMQAGRLPEAQDQLEAYLALETDAGRRAEIARDVERLRATLREGGMP